MSCLNCGLLLILISMLVTKINLANGKSYDDKYRRGVDEARRYLTPRYPLRHNPYYNGRKHKFHSYDFSYLKWKKPTRRFSALDKVDDRLNNAAYDFFDKSLKMTTSFPSDVWEDDATTNSTLYTSMYMKYKSDSDKTTGNHIEKSKYDRILSWDKGDYDLDFVGDGKGFLQDFTTFKPSEISNQETTHHYRTNYIEKTSTSVTTTTTAAAATTTTTTTTTEQPSTRRSTVSFPSTIEENTRKTTPKTPLPGVHAVFKHLTHLKKEGRCRIPKAKIVWVQEIHPDAGKTYIPSCTILHRCGPDTGCCEDIKDVCKPKNITKVELYFLTSGIDQTHKEVEKLHFENHTECECRPRSEDIMPRDSAYFAARNTRFTARETTAMNKSVKHKNCTCPFHYSPRYFHSGSCICDCFDKQSDCLAQKKGKALFSHADRMCIKQKICYYPSCEFGAYISFHGRCPKKSEKHFKYKNFISRSRIT